MPTLPSLAAAPLYALFAAGLLFVASRAAGRISLRAALCLAALPLAFTGGALLSGRVLAPLDLAYSAPPLSELREEAGIAGGPPSRFRSDVAFCFMPYRKSVRYAFEHGEWPLWNPFLLSGEILQAGGEATAYHPIQLAGLALPLGPSLTFVAAATLLLLALGGFLFFREIGCREPAAVFGAAAWTWSSFSLFWIGWVILFPVAAFPLMLLGIRRLVEDPGGRAVGLLAAAFALSLLGGHAETTMHSVVLAGVYGGLELVGRERRLRIVALAVLAGVLALLLCAFELLPFLAALPRSWLFAERTAGEGGGVATLAALAHARVSFVPFVYGLPWAESIADARLVRPWSAYAGSLVFAPALLGLLRSRWRGRYWLLGFYVLGVLAQVRAPALHWLFERLPLFDIAFNARMVFASSLALCALAALGVEEWTREPASRRLSKLGVLVAGALLLLVAASWPGMRESGLSAGFLAERSFVLLVFPLLAAALLPRARGAAAGVAILLGLLLCQRVVEMAPFHRSFPEAAFFPRLAVLDSLPRDEAPYRIVGQGRVLRPNLAAFYELEDVRGFEVMKSRRLFETYPLWSSARHEHNARVDDVTRPFLSFLNVRFALVPRGAPAPDGWRRHASGSGLAVYENPGALGRAFVPERVVVGAAGPPVLRAMAGVRDFAKVAWIEQRDRPPGAAPAERENGPGRVRVERRGLRLRLDVEMERPGWVVLSQTAGPGWRAESRGRALPLHPANHAFLAFHLPEGRHPVELWVRPRTFTVGLATSGLTALGLAAATWAARRRSRSRANDLR